MRLSGLFALLLLALLPLHPLAETYLVPQLGHSAAITHLQYSPDGQFLVSASEDASLRLWDSRGNLVSVLEGHGADLVQSLFIQDQTLISLARNGELFAWHSIGETRIRLDGFTENLPVTGHQLMDYNPKSEILAVAGYKSLQWSPISIQLLREEKPLPVKTLTLPFKVKALALSPAGNLAAVVNEEGWLALVDLDKGEIQQQKQLNQPWQALAFRSDKQLVLAGNNISLFDLEKMSLGRQIEVSGFWGIFALTLSPDTIHVAALASEAVVINLDTGETRARIPKMHSAGLTFHPRGEMLALVSEESPRCYSRSANIVILTLDGQRLASFQPGPQSLTMTADVSAGGLLAINRCDRDIQIWDLNNFSRKAILTSPDASIAALAFSDDGQSLYSASYQGQLRRWQLATGSSELLAKSEGEYFSALATHDKTLAWGDYNSDSKKAFVWIAEDGKQTRQVQHTFNLKIQQLAFADEGRQLLVQDFDKKLYRVDVASGRILSESRKKKDLLDDKKVYSHAGHLLAVVEHKELAIYDGKTHSLKRKMGGLNPLRLFFTSDDRYLVLVSPDGQIKLLDIAADFSLTKGIQTLSAYSGSNAGFAMDYQNQQVIWRDESQTQPVLLKEVANGQMRWHKFTATTAKPQQPATGH
jgi:WD40 repeat protein